MAMQEARQVHANQSLFTLELANLTARRETGTPWWEYLTTLRKTPGNINYVKNLLQILLTKPEEIEALERLLYEEVKEPGFGSLCRPIDMVTCSKEFLQIPLTQGSRRA